MYWVLGIYQIFGIDVQPSDSTIHVMVIYSNGRECDIDYGRRFVAVVLSRTFSYAQLFSSGHCLIRMVITVPSYSLLSI